MRRMHQRGSIGFVVILVVALIIGILALRSYQGLSVTTVSLPNAQQINGASPNSGATEVQSPQSVIQKFKGEAKHIEELQKKALPPEPAGQE
jgi:hypothetical protein